MQSQMGTIFSCFAVVGTETVDSIVLVQEGTYHELFLRLEERLRNWIDEGKDT